MTSEREQIARVIDPWAMETESRDWLTRYSQENALSKADQIIAMRFQGPDFEQGWLDAEGEMASLRTQLAEATAERDMWKGECEDDETTWMACAEFHVEKVKELLARAEQAEAHRNRLVEAVTPFLIRPEHWREIECDPLGQIFEEADFTRVRSALDAVQGGK